MRRELHGLSRARVGAKKEVLAALSRLCGQTTLAAGSESALDGRLKLAGKESLGKIIAVCISRVEEKWSIPGIPFYCHTLGWRSFRRFEMSKERVAYLAERRNKAVSEALSLFPTAEDILMIDSYYIHQTEQIEGLVAEYVQLSSSAGSKGCILGASTWVQDKTRITNSKHFFDQWTTPEGGKFSLGYARKHGGVIPVGAVGACYLYPRKVWEAVGYGVPDDLHGCEHNWLCEQSGLPVLLTFNEMVWHDPVVYPWLKRIRTTLHLGRFVRRLHTRATKAASE